jgi:hypothetical protein
MKNFYHFSLKIIVLFSLITFSLNAQIYTPSGTIQGSSGNTNVGIGTTNPSYSLDLLSSNPRLRVKDNSTGSTVLDLEGGSGSFYVANDNSTGSAFGGSAYAATLYRSGAYPIAMWTNGAERMRINSSGNVGIGTTMPISGGNAAKWLTIDGTTNYGGGLISSINGNPKAYFYSENNYAIVQGATGQGVKLMPNGIEGVTVITNGNVGIGTTSPDAKLAVKGQIHAQEVKVDLLGAMVPDYVFAKDYQLKTLMEVDAYIKANSHLPEVPSAQEIEKNGLLLGEMNMVLLKKIEELTLYMIEMKKEIGLLKNENRVQQEEIKILKK